MKNSFLMKNGIALMFLGGFCVSASLKCQTIGLASSSGDQFPRAGQGFNTLGHSTSRRAVTPARNKYSSKHTRHQDMQGRDQDKNMHNKNMHSNCDKSDDYAGEHITPDSNYDKDMHDKGTDGNWADTSDNSNKDSNTKQNTEIVGPGPITAPNKSLPAPNQ